MNMLYTVTQVSRVAGISPTTARMWGRELATVMSAGANPPAGQDRRYSEDDAAILHTARVLRAEGRSWDDITAAVGAGDRILPEGRPAGEGEQAAGEASPGSLVLADWWDRVTSLHRAEVERLQQQLGEAQEARIAAEREAARLSGILEAKAAQEETGAGRSWLSRLLRRNPAE